MVWDGALVWDDPVINRTYQRRSLERGHGQPDRFVRVVLQLSHSIWDNRDATCTPCGGWCCCRSHAPVVGGEVGQVVAVQGIGIQPSAQKLACLRIMSPSLKS